MASELTTGILVMKEIDACGKRISMLVTQQKGVFTKKARGKILFSCKDGSKIKEAIAKTKAAEKAAKAAADYKTAKANYDNSCRLAEEKYSRLASVGLDFKTVYQAAIKRIGNNKFEQAAIFHSKNPGERLYKIGCEDPEIKAKLDLEENQELLNSMDSRKVDKDSLKGSKVKDGELYTPEKVKGMSVKQIMEHLPEIQEAQKKWKK